MESLEILSSEELLFPESSEVLSESLPESDAASESDAAPESDALSESDAASQEVVADPAVLDQDQLSVSLDEIHTELLTVNESLSTCNGLLLALLFFTVAQWVVSKVKGSVERMLLWKI